MDASEEIQKFLEGEMNQAEVAAFEKKMAADPEILERVEMHRQLDAALGNREEAAVENKLKEIMAKAPALKGQERSRNRWLRPLSIAASAIILLSAIGLIYSWQSSPQSSAELYAAHYVPYDGSAELRSGDSLSQSLFSKAFDAYDSANFAEALKEFQAIEALSPGNPRANFYLGICLLETGDPGTALQSFEKVIAEGQNLYLDQAHWYAGLSCLQLEKTDCVRDQMSLLSQQTGKYQKPSQEILSALSSEK